ncbi:hypothetical protein Hanom_Chr13g01228331 [Helianthus anomalus]
MLCDVVRISYKCTILPSPVTSTFFLPLFSFYPHQHQTLEIETELERSAMVKLLVHCLRPAIRLRHV